MEEDSISPEEEYHDRFCRFSHSVSTSRPIEQSSDDAPNMRMEATENLSQYGEGDFKTLAEINGVNLAPNLHRY